MGHRLSKSSISACSPNGKSHNNRETSINYSKTTNLAQTISPSVCIIPSEGSTRSESNHIKDTNSAVICSLQVQQNHLKENDKITSSISSNNSLSSSVSSVTPRQIIIKIQLTKMEHGNEKTTQNVESAVQQRELAQNILRREFFDNSTVNPNANHLGSSAANIANLALNEGLPAPNNAVGSKISNSMSKTVNNNASVEDCMNSLHLCDSYPHDNVKSDSVEYCNLSAMGPTRPMESSQQKMINCHEYTDLNHSSKVQCACPMADCGTTSEVELRPNTSHRRYFRRIVESVGSSLIRSNRVNKSRTGNRQSQQHSNNTFLASHVISSQQRQFEISPLMNPTSTAVTGISASTTMNANIQPVTESVIHWTPNTRDVIIASPQVVVVYPSTSLVTLGHFDENAIRLVTTTEIKNNGTTNSNEIISNTGNTVLETDLVRTIPSGPIVHSQVDFVHYLVPDLQRIMNSSFYWGKMDRYEAERLLESKPEGTFLLRDSAQEEFLFSVTFRKYGRSLHARIEQNGHKFSFDCHDPAVFSAPTVTGLLEHYKDPACVMFFEPMLTIPFHRKTVFSLQELCRGVIASHTTYDGINEFELPPRIKSYLKKYHYKQKLRVRPFETCFSCI